MVRLGRSVRERLGGLYELVGQADNPKSDAILGLIAEIQGEADELYRVAAEAATTDFAKRDGEEIQTTIMDRIRKAQEYQDETHKLRRRAEDAVGETRGRKPAEG